MSTTDDPIRSRIALIAHDNKKEDLRDWARFNRALLASHHLCATGTTGWLLRDERQEPDYGVHAVRHRAEAERVA